MKYLPHLLITILCTASPSPGQNRFSIEVGGRAGISSGKPLERNLSGAAAIFSHYEADNARILAGPSFALMVNDRVGAQVDVIHKSFDIHSGFTGGLTPDGRFVTRTEALTHATSWETAVLGRYAFTKASTRPFAVGGLSFPKFSGKSESRVLAISPTADEISRSSSSGPIHPEGGRTGLVMGGGLELRAHHLRLAPEFRYIRRNNDAQQNGSILIPSNQFEFLLGLAFRFH